MVKRPTNNKYDYPSYKPYAKKHNQKHCPERYYPFFYSPR